MVYLNVTIKGKVDSRQLWKDIEKYDVNVTDLEAFTAVYGKVSMYDSMFIIDICRKYGDIETSVTAL